MKSRMSRLFVSPRTLRKGDRCVLGVVIERTSTRRKTFDKESSWILVGSVLLCLKSMPCAIRLLVAHRSS